MDKGRIVLIPFPFTDLSGQKVRPAVVLHASRGEDCIVAFISSKSATKQAFSIPLKPSAENGLKVSSALRVDKLATLQKRTVIGEIGTLDRSSLQKVDASLRKLLRL